MRLLLVPALLIAASGYNQEAVKWRADYESRLKAPDGWLSVVGLYWLHEGVNKPEQVSGGVFRLHNGVVSWEPSLPSSGARRTLKPDDPGPPDVVRIGSVSVTVIRRGGKLGVRVRDSNAPARLHFTGSKWFPPSEAWRVRAKWVAYPQPKQIAITNILGMTEPEPSPGYAEFTVEGRTMRLEPVIEDNELFFMFRDKTNARDTYGAGRFLYAKMPAGPHSREVVLDFNQAHNPPCAFTPYATCPLPPRQNTLSIAVEAGEKSYGARHP